METAEVFKLGELGIKKCAETVRSFCFSCSTHLGEHCFGVSTLDLDKSLGKN